MYRNLLHFYTLLVKEQEGKLKKFPFTITPKKKAINISKEAKDLYAENYKVPMKEIKDDTDI